MLSARLLILILLGGCGGGPAPTPPPDASSDPLEARRKALSDEVRDMVKELEAAGRYDCCTQTPCKMCALRAGGCRCGEGLRNGEPVCEECAMMWKMGKGAEDVDPKTVRSFLEAQREATDKAQAPACGCGEEEAAGGAAVNPARFVPSRPDW